MTDKALKTWRDGFAGLLPLSSLEALAEALRTDDPRLTQGSTTTPPPLMCVQDWPCEAGCALGFCGAVEGGGFMVATVGECEEFVGRMCFEADELLGEPAACRHFLNWFDMTPRDQMRAELLPEVERAIEHRKGKVAA